MIQLHRLKGDAFWLNPDLVAYAEAKHDTVLALLDGRHLVVAESPEEVAAAVMEWRAAILATAGRVRHEIDEDEPTDDVVAVRRSRLAAVDTRLAAEDTEA